ncbi:MAG: potassium channel family protein [Chloroflexia bacterium]
MLIRDKQVRTDLYYRYSNASELPLLVLAVLMIPVILAPEVFPISPDYVAMLDDIDWFIYACFAADFAIKIFLAPSKLRHIRENWIDVLVLALPLLRPLRLVRGVRLLRLLRLARLLVIVGEIVSKVRGILTGRGLHWVMLVTLGVIAGSAGLVTVFERGEGGNIRDFPAALWWAVTTVTTVGYGDTVPVSPEGRGVAVFLMVTGIAFFGVLTANVAAYFVESKESGANEELQRKLDQVLERLAAIEAAQYAAREMEEDRNAG